MLFLQIMAALYAGLLACAVGLLYAVVRGRKKAAPSQSPARTPSPQGEGFEGSTADGQEHGSAERVAEKKYTEGVLNILNYSAEDARKGAAEL